MSASSRVLRSAALPSVVGAGDWWPPPQASSASAAVPAAAMELQRRMGRLLREQGCTRTYDRGGGLDQAAPVWAAAPPRALRKAAEGPGRAHRLRGRGPGAACAR